MIIKGNPAGSVGYWSKHLLRDDTNEKAEVKEISGLAARDLPGALREMQAVASGSRSQGNFMYQANINPLAHEHLTPEQWREAIDTLEKNLGLEGHQRVVVEHIKEGRQHFHVVWNRVDIETMKVADMGGNYLIHEQTARQLEARFELTPTPTLATAAERNQGPQLWEIRAAERSGIDPNAMKEELTQLWRSADSGQAFKTAIEERGYILAKGDRRDFCVIDRAGDAHSLARRLEGVKTPETRARMSDIDRQALPTVKEARAEQRSRPRIENAPVNLNAQSEASRQRPLDPDLMVRVWAAVKPPDFLSAKIETFKPRQETPPAPSEGRADISPSKLAGAAAGASLNVASAVTGGVEKLADFLADFLTGGSPQPKRDAADQIIEQRRALAALENIRDYMERGKSLRPEDVRNLTPEHLMNLRDKGDDYLRTIIQRMAEEERERDHDRGRERER